MRVKEPCALMIKIKFFKEHRASCQKCIDAIEKANREDLSDEGWTPYHITHAAITESECEFWAHKELNNLSDKLGRFAAWSPEWATFCELKEPPD